MRKLIVNADDFGFTPDVNRGIAIAFQDGILTSATLMATGEAFDDAIRIARENPALDVGCHLVLVGSPGLPASVFELARAVALRKIDVYPELKRQIENILSAGIKPTHLDTHKHTHLLPPVLDAVARLAAEFHIPWVRAPFDAAGAAPGTPWKREMVKRAIGFTEPRFRRVLRACGVSATDHFTGFRITGNFDAAALTRALTILPEGLTEFMCHPGFCGDALRKASTRLKESREAELRALVAPEVRRALGETGIELVSFRTAGA